MVEVRGGTPEASLRYRAVVERIKGLRFEELSEAELQELMYLAYASAREFASSLRVATKLYPNNPRLTAMASGELDTNNLQFDDYRKRGDHADFLQHFLPTLDPSTVERLERSANVYVTTCMDLSDETRAMSVFSREKELPGIFERVLTAKNWNEKGLAAFRYYLEQHIALDSGVDGHAELTQDFLVDDSVEDFYKARLNLYRAIPTLFKDEA